MDCSLEEITKYIKDKEIKLNNKVFILVLIIIFIILNIIFSPSLPNNQNDFAPIATNNNELNNKDNNLIEKGKFNENDINNNKINEKDNNNFEKVISSSNKKEDKIDDNESKIEKLKYKKDPLKSQNTVFKLNKNIKENKDMKMDRKNTESKNEKKTNNNEKLDINNSKQFNEINGIPEPSFFRYFEIISMFGFIGVIIYLMCKNEESYNDSNNNNFIRNIINNNINNNEEDIVPLFNSKYQKNKYINSNNDLKSTLLPGEVEYYEKI